MSNSLSFFFFYLLCRCIVIREKRRRRRRKKSKGRRIRFLKFVLQGREGWSKLPAPTHQHASPHITDNYSFRSLRGPIVSGDPRVSDTLWGSPISLSPPLVLQPTPFRVFLLDSILVALVSPGCVFQQLYLSPFLLFFGGGGKEKKGDGWSKKYIFYDFESRVWILSVRGIIETFRIPFLNFVSMDV